MTAPALSPQPRLLTTDASGPQTNIWWGIVGLVTVEVTVFTALLTSYFYFEARSPGWPPEEAPKLLLPTVNTVVLLLSSLAISIADRGISKGNQFRLRAGLLASIALAILFLALKAWELADKPYQWDDHAYGSIVWLTLGLHSLHVFSVLLKSCVMAVLAFRGFFSRHSYVGVQVNGLYWHFVVVIWIPIYFTIYISPRF